MLSRRTTVGGESQRILWLFKQGQSFDWLVACYSTQPSEFIIRCAFPYGFTGVKWTLIVGVLRLERIFLEQHHFIGRLSEEFSPLYFPAVEFVGEDFLLEGYLMMFAYLYSRLRLEIKHISEESLVSWKSSFAIDALIRHIRTHTNRQRRARVRRHQTPKLNSRMRNNIPPLPICIIRKQRSVQMNFLLSSAARDPIFRSATMNLLMRMMMNRKRETDHRRFSFLLIHRTRFDLLPFLSSFHCGEEIFENN